MSQETFEWLNNYCLIGYTDKRGHAWHYRESAQGTEPNHYPGPIPVEDITRRLFNFEGVPVFFPVPVPAEKVTDEFIAAHGWVSKPFAGPDGKKYCLYHATDRLLVAANDNFDLLGVFKDGYQPHQYTQWLLDNPAHIVDSSKGELGFGSALLLRKRGVAFVQIELPDSITTPEGVDFRPWLGAGTSFDGSLATTYKVGYTDVVCDNTKEMFLAERTPEFRVKHSRNSGLRIGEAREALEIIFKATDAITDEIHQLCATTVTEAEWQRVLDAIVPVSEKEGRSRTVATNKREKLNELWHFDSRVAPWAHTAWGVVQAFNTFDQHFSTVRNVEHRAERNFTNALTGATGVSDAKVLKAVETVLDKEVLTLSAA